MAEEIYYAWSPIRYGGEVSPQGILDPRSIKEVKFGEKVTAAAMGIDDADWEGLKAAGAVRTQKPPDLPEGYQGSVMDYWYAQLAEAGQPLDTTGGTGLLDEVERQAVAQAAAAEVAKVEKAGASGSK